MPGTLSSQTWFTPGRFIVAVYIIVVIVIWWVLPTPAGMPPITAVRYLSPNTRIDASLLKRPRADWIGDSARLTLALQRMQGKYLRGELRAGQPISEDLLADWPAVNAAGSLVVPITTTPEYSLLNAGTRVLVSLSDRSEIARVLAIVPHGTQWLVFLSACDLPDTQQADLRQATLSVASLPEPPPQRSTS